MPVAAPEQAVGGGAGRACILCTFLRGPCHHREAPPQSRSGHIQVPFITPPGHMQGVEQPHSNSLPGLNGPLLQSPLGCKACLLPTTPQIPPTVCAGKSHPHPDWRRKLPSPTLGSACTLSFHAEVWVLKLSPGEGLPTPPTHTHTCSPALPPRSSQGNPYHQPT